MLTCLPVLAVSLPAMALDWHDRTGVRFGWNYLEGGDQLEELESNHMFAMGLQAQQALEGGAWLDVLFVENVTVSGLDQSIVAPSASFLVGFEIDKQVQLAVGPNLSAFDPSGEGHNLHLVAAVGTTADAGIFSVPIHLSYIPDVRVFNRYALKTGVNW
jgi:hypothetical protein